MAASIMVRGCQVWHRWTPLKLQTGYLREVYNVQIGSAATYPFKKTEAKLLKRQFPCGISHMTKRALHATPLCFQEVMLTSERYEVQRLPFAHVSDQDLSYFECLMSGRVITDADELKPFNVDWLNTVRGRLFCSLN